MAQMRRWGPSQDWGTTTAWDDGSMSSVTASPELFYSVTFSSLHFPGLLGIDHIRPSLLFKTEFLIIRQALLSTCFVPGPVPALRTLAQTGPESSAELTVQWAVKYMPPTSRPWDPTPGRAPQTTAVPSQLSRYLRGFKEHKAGSCPWVLVLDAPGLNSDTHTPWARASSLTCLSLSLCVCEMDRGTLPWRTCRCSDALHLCSLVLAKGRWLAPFLLPAGAEAGVS